MLRLDLANQEIKAEEKDASNVVRKVTLRGNAQMEAMTITEITEEEGEEEDVVDSEETGMVAGKRIIIIRGQFLLKRKRGKEGEGVAQVQGQRRGEEGEGIVQEVLIPTGRSAKGRLAVAVVVKVEEGSPNIAVALLRVGEGGEDQVVQDLAE